MSNHHIDKLILLLAMGGVVFASVACPTGGTAIANCATCTASSYYVVCETCLNTYYLSSNVCKSCALNFANCLYCALDASQTLQCLTCNANYGLLSGQCLPCSSISGCQTCTIVQNFLLCNSCISPLVLTSTQTQCLACPIANCTSCSSSPSGQFVCSSCSSGYYLSSNACLQCASAIQYCTICQYANSVVTCSTCASTSLYLSNNKCVANCTTAGYPQCLTCQLTSLAGGVITCTTCKDGYFLDLASQTCRGCSQALVGCSSCSTSGSVTSCLACSTGYFLTGSPAACVLCSTVHPNCLLCGSACTKCNDYYYLNTTDLVCYSCSSSPYITRSFTAGTCQTCVVDTTAVTLVCTTCAVGYYFLDALCTGCPSSCSACSSAINCSSCKAGYLLSGSSCQLCSATYPHCQYCNAVQCTDCQVGYYTLDNKNCLLSCQVPNCLTCVQLNNLQCFTCKAGYSLVNSVCQMMTCTAPLQFNGVACVCPVGTGLKSNLCSPCADPNCMFCTYAACQQCLQGYYLNGAACSSCGANCKLCLTPSKCLLCDDGFYFISSSCLPISSTTLPVAGVYLSSNLNRLCSLGCLKCTSSTSCLSCNRGYVLNISACLPCPSNCQGCNLTSSQITQQGLIDGALKNITTTVYVLVCLACDSGSALVDNSCKVCQDALCISCDFNPQFCIQCGVGFTPNSTGSCAPCAAGCDFCDGAGPGTCDSDACSVGYTRINTTLCLPCMQGCPKCNSTLPFLCIGCLIGTFNSTESKLCENCPLGCATCTNSTTCLSCLNQYQLISSLCQPFCILPCLTCSWSQGVQLCTSCLRSYTLISGVCTANTSCTISATCQFCIFGQFAYRGLCYPCPSYCSHCLFSPPTPAYDIAAVGSTYLNYLVCQLCSIGYYSDSNSNSCLKCSQNCQSCTSLQNCLNCTDGYYTEQRHYNYVGLAYNLGLCQNCDTLCRSCALSANRCTSCRDNYTLIGFRCIAWVNMTFTVTLATPDGSTPEGVTNNLKRVFEDFYAVLGGEYSDTPELVNYQSVTLGSLILTGTASITFSDPASTYNTASTALQAKPSLGGYSMTSYTLAPQGFTAESPSTSKSSSSTIIIVVGAVVAALAVVVTVVCLVKRRKGEERQSRTGESNRETTQNEQATSKGILKQEMPSNDPNNKLIKEVSHISQTQSKKTGSDVNEPSNPPTHSLTYTYEPSYAPHSRSKRPAAQDSAFQSKTTKLVPPSQYAPHSHAHQSSKQVPFNLQSQHIPNESNITKPKYEHKQTRRQKRLRQGGEQEKYVPNKNSHFI